MRRLINGSSALQSLLYFTFIHLPYCINAQTWHSQIIRAEITISFPTAPKHVVIDEKGKEAYISQTNGCRFMVGVAPDAIENYSNFQKLSISKQNSKALTTLEGVANGKINSNSQHLISMKSFKSGNNVGIDVQYTTLEPSNPESRKRFSTLLLVKSTLYIFDCWYIDEHDHQSEKEKFFKSILIKDKS